MALDHGSRRIGVALSDALRLTAQPHGTLPAGDSVLAELRNLAVERDVEVIVVGLPTGLDGKEGAAAAAARRFAVDVADSLHLPVELYDERFTTVVAERVMIEGGASRARRRERRDGIAAAVFLQDYLDATR